MLTYIALFPALVAILYLRSVAPAHRGLKSCANAFTLIYLPTLLLVPYTYAAELPSFPDLKFAQAALIPISLAFFFHSLLKASPITRKFCVLDVLVLSYVAVCVYSEYATTTTAYDGIVGSSWVNLLSEKTLTILLPYLLARHLLHPEGRTPLAAKVLITCTLINLVICAYEWRMTYNLHERLTGLFFPNNTYDEPLPSMRFGWVRLTGPFTHPILFAMMIATCLIFNSWLTKNRLWKKGTLFLPISVYIKGKAIGCALFVGLILTFSRGPLFSLILAGLFLNVGYKRHRYTSLILRLTIFTAAIVVLYSTYLTYTEFAGNAGETPLEKTIIYRVKLIDQYWKYIAQSPWLGWGATTWPAVKNATSIDNEYLFLQMKHGLWALILLVSIMAYSSLRILIRGMSTTLKDPSDRGLAFVFLCLIFMMSISLITVYLGAQTKPLFFIVLGWAQGFLDSTARRRTMTSPQRPPEILQLATSSA